MKAKVTPHHDTTKPAYKWRVWYDAEGSGRKMRIFKTKTAAHEFADDQDVDAENLGNRKAAALTHALKDEAVNCARLLAPYKRTLTQAVEHYIKYLKATEQSAPVDGLVEKFLESQRHAKKSPYYRYELKNRLGMFVADHGSKFASEVTPAILTAWIHGRPVGDRTKNHLRRVLSAFFAWAKIQGKCSTNPARDVGRVKVHTGRPAIYTPAQARALLGRAAALPVASRDILATVVLGMFAGLRPFEAQRLTWGQILRRGQTWRIDLSAAGTKTAKRRLVDVTDTLRSWLEKFFPFAKSGPIVQPNFWKRVRTFRHELAQRADDHEPINWIDDGLRHMFASYTLAGGNDAAATARALGHSDTAMLFAHYAEVATPEDAKEFFALTPAAVLDESKVVSITSAAA
ncbi:MAG: tyrosine-type recombinase/integrase [Chthoniobacteraceae bacterium]|jgi:integrase